MKKQELACVLIIIVYLLLNYFGKGGDVKIQYKLKIYALQRNSVGWIGVFAKILILAPIPYVWCPGSKELTLTY